MPNYYSIITIVGINSNGYTYEISEGPSENDYYSLLIALEY